MVNLTRIYTRTGDDGMTHLGDMSRTSKTDVRLQAYADANEANAAIGVAVAAGDLREDVRATLLRIQNDLFDVGADLCTPLQETYEYPPLRVEQPWIDELEADCDRYLGELEKLRSFILPGGTPGSAYLHVATTVARRAERQAWAAIDGLRRPARRRQGRGRGQRAHREVPQPALGPAVRARPRRQPADRRRRALAARWRRARRPPPRRARRVRPRSTRRPPRLMRRPDARGCAAS